MNFNLLSKSIIYCVFLLGLGSCAYFNTFYNARQYYEEAEKIRLQKEGESIPITAMDKYGKTIQKCQKVLNDFPETKFRIDAILLMAKARYYRKDYDFAIDDLKVVSADGNQKQIEEAQYWRSLCKWKKGNAQTGIDELTDLLGKSKSKEVQSRCHLSLAEIANELKDSDLALTHLQEGAKLTKDRAQKGVIYTRLAEMAFNRKNYELAINAYGKVVANSISKEKVEKAHLQILKILRLEKEYRSAARKIKGMLTDDKFKRIAGYLELELVQLYRAQGEESEIESRLEIIVNAYQRTPVSAEAYYYLGQIYTSQKWDLEKSKDYFNLVSKESSKSLFTPMAKSKSNAIGRYQEAEKDLESHFILLNQDSTLLVSESDTTKQSVSIIKPDRSIPELYYQLGDLEAFSFNRNSEGIAFLQKIITDYSESSFHAKSMFTIAFMYESNGDSLNALLMRNRLKKDYPKSEYAAYLSDDIIVEKKEQELVFSQANKEISLNPEESISLFKKTINLNTETEVSVIAAYTISYYYDQNAEIDSAMKYYEWIQENHPRSDQAQSASLRLKSLQMVLSALEVEQDSTQIAPEQN